MRKTLFAAALLALIASPAFPHVGVDTSASFAAGVAHPLAGTDHIAVMVAVGLWAALKGGRALWTWPATFVGVMLVGCALGMAHAPLPGVEPAILASVAALGILVGLAIDVPVAAGALLIGAFAVFHGYAHGSEAAQGVSGLGYMTGFALATAALHGVGIAFVQSMNRLHAPSLVRIAGMACLLAGTCPLVGAL